MSWNSYKHPISDIRDWNRNNRLELKPDFQRNEVWTKAAQIMLIDTIIRKIPIPKIYIKSIIHEGNTYRVVLDGQQRLTTIMLLLKAIDDLIKDPDNITKKKTFFNSKRKLLTVFLLKILTI